MKKRYALQLLSLSLAVVLLAGLLSGCAVFLKEKPVQNGIFGNSDTSKKDPVTEDDTDKELTDEMSCSFAFLNEATGEWEPVADSEELFGNAEWEPSRVKTVLLKLENTSKIGFDWTLGFACEGSDQKLAEVLQVYFNIGPEPLEAPDRIDMEGYFWKSELVDLLNEGQPLHGAFLEAGETVYLGVAMKLDEAVGNEYHALSLEDLSLWLTTKERLLTATSADKEDGDDFSIEVKNGRYQFEDVVPGDFLTAQPSVHNTSAYDQYIRVTVTVSDLAAFQEGLENYEAEDLFVEPRWGDDEAALELDSLTEENDCAVLVLYADQILAPGESILLCNGVQFPAELSANAVGSTTLSDGFTIELFVEAVHTANTAIKDAKAAFAYAASKQ